MEFKGTKGPWQTSHRKRKDGMYSTEVYCGKGETVATISWYPKPTENGVIGTYRDANALLISKAPEMLDMIEELVHLFEYSNNSQQEVELLDQAKQLIKEATEL